LRSRQSICTAPTRVWKANIQSEGFASTLAHICRTTPAHDRPDSDCLEQVRSFFEIGTYRLVIKSYDQITAIPVPESKSGAYYLCFARFVPWADPILDLDVQAL
jgi:hypothetical protein